MQNNETFLKLREVCKASRQAVKAAHQAETDAVHGLLGFLRNNPPKSFRIQEAYRNPDGTFAAPHWDEVSEYEGQKLIDGEELEYHVIEGEWTLVYENPEDDPRPGYRRVIDVVW